MKPFQILLVSTVLSRCLAISLIGAGRGAAGNPAAHLAPPVRVVREDILSRSELESQGRFKEAAGLLAKTLAGTDLPVSQRKTFEFELDRLKRIRKTFPLTRPVSSDH